MPGRQAKTLSAADVDDLLVFASRTRNPLRNRVIVLLSAKAGLRAGEIANLTWDMVVDATGQVSGLIELADNAAKKRSGRSIPIHPDLAVALATWRQVAPPSQYVIASERGGRMRPLSIVVWFNRAFNNIGLKGCSSHSGRRTFVTRAARIVHKAGGLGMAKCSRPLPLNHRHELALGIGVAVDVPLRGLDRPMTGQQLH